MQNVREIMVNYDGLSNKKLGEICFKNFMTINNMNLRSKYLYSTHHEIKNTPLVLRVFLWRYVSHCNSRNFWTARDRFFFWRPEEKSIYKSYILEIFVGLTPKSLHPRSQINSFPTISAVLNPAF